MEVREDGYLTEGMGVFAGMWVDFGEGGYLSEGTDGGSLVSKRQFSGGLFG